MSDKVDKIVEENKDVWKTRSSYFSWLKGAFRKAWSKHPVRVKLLKKKSFKIPNTNPRSMKRFPEVPAVKCEICQGTFRLTEVQVDHKLEETASLTSLEDIQSCVEKLLVVCEDDLRVLCTGCHSVVSLSQKLGISFADAAVEQKIIYLLKNKQQALDKLEEYGYTGHQVINNEKRRALLRQILTNELKENK